jgi:hypothetical protein
VLAAATLGLAGLWARARRWRYLFPPRSRPPGLLPAMMIGYMANNVLPLRAGEVVRVYVVARRWGASGEARAGDAFWLTLATLVVERVLDSLAIVLIVAVLVLRIDVPAVFRWGASILLAVDVVAVAALTTVALAPARGRRLLGQWTRRWPALERPALRVFQTFLRGLDGIRAPAHLLPTLGWTVLIWIAGAAAAAALLEAFGIRLPRPFLAGWTVIAFVGLGISIPSAPGYVGVWHAATVFALDRFGVAQTAAVGYALVYHASQLLPVTIVGWACLLREQLTLAEARHGRSLFDDAAES